MRKLYLLITYVIFSSYAYGQTIRGTITDANSNEKLIGVNIVLDNGGGTSTDIYGKYLLQIPIGENKITFKLFWIRP